MKKVAQLLALGLFTFSLTSCEAETDVAETETLFETLATDDVNKKDNGRD